MGWHFLISTLSILLKYVGLGGGMWGVFLKSCSQPYIPRSRVPNKSLADCILLPGQELCGRLNGQGEEDSEFPLCVQLNQLSKMV